MLHSCEKIYDNIIPPSGSGGGGGTDPADQARITNLENNEFKILYYQAINTSTGTITKPTNSIIFLNDFPQGYDAVVETIVNGEPTGEIAKTSGGTAITVTSFDTSGNYTLSGTPSSFPVALLYVLRVKAIDLSNLTFDNIIESQNLALTIASVSSINTGTDNSDYITSLGLEGSKYLTQKMGKITATASGTNTYTATLNPAITSYNGIGAYINFTNANTVTNPTLSLNGLSADGFVQSDGSAIFISQLKGIVFVKHNGTAWQVLGSPIGTNTGTVAAGDTVLLKSNVLGGDLSNLRKKGTTNYEAWYSSTVVPFTPTTLVVARDSIKAIPYVASISQTLDRIAVEITTAGTAGSVVRLSIYDDVNGTPTNLVLDAGTIAGDSATNQTITINKTLPPGIYYLCLVHNSITNITFRAIPSTFMINFFGYPSGGGTTVPSSGISSTFTYSTMPSTFPVTSFSVNLSTCPFIKVRLS